MTAIHSDTHDNLAPITDKHNAVTVRDFRRWNTGIAVTAVLVMLTAGFACRWIADDGLIYARAVEQILAGNGPVFNAGERAESSTGTLWQWLLVLAGVFAPSAIPWAAIYLGLALSAAAIGFAVTGSQQLHGGATVPAGVVVLLATPPMWDFATSGLETGLGFAWIAGGWWLLVRSRDSGADRSYATAFVLGLGPLVRPDLALVSIVFLIALWLLQRPRLGTTFGLIAAAGALPVAYQVFRMGYYGVLVPLPAISKEATTSFWLRGFGYFTDLFATYWLWLPVAFVLWLGLRRRVTKADRILILAPVIAGTLSMLYVIKVGGDFMHGRMLLPGLLLVLLPFSCLPRPSNRAALSSACVAMAAWSVWCVADLRPSYSPGPGSQGIADERAYYVQALGVSHPASGEDFVRPWPEERDRVRFADHELVFLRGDKSTVPLSPTTPGRVGVVWSVLGTTGVLTPLDQTVIDPIGLSYPLAAHLAPQARGRVGHEKHLPQEWITADYGIETAQNATAKRALACGELAELQESVRAPMSWQRFVDNFLGSFRRTALRVPEDPAEAERRFCGRVG